VTYVLISTVLDRERTLLCNRLRPVSNKSKVQFEALNHARVQRLAGVLDLKLIKVLINTEVHITRGSIALNGVLDLK
jgi:hypothetical protein